MSNDAISKLIPQVQCVSGVADLLHFRARSHGASDAVICDDRRLSYAKLASRARGISSALASKGVKKSDRVGILMPNGNEYVAAFFGILGIAAVVVPINPLLHPDEIARILRDSEAICLIAHETVLKTALQSLPQATLVRSLLVAPIPREGLKKWPAADIDLEELSENGAPDRPEWSAPVDAENDLAAIVYTTSTTGEPHGAMLTHHNLMSVFPFGLEKFDIGENDKCLATLPLYQTYGMTVLMIGTISRGATLIIMPTFDGKSAFEAIERYRVTILPAVPKMYSQLLLKWLKSYDLASLHLCFSTGALHSNELFGRVETAFRVPVIECYTFTELACPATINPLHGARKKGSVGPAAAGVEIAIFDGAGRTLPPGHEHVGEIAVAGANLMRGYWKQPQATAEVLKDGWFFTGDLGFLDDDGYLFITGRKNDVIAGGGQTIYFAEVEAVIAQMPGVKECAVIPDPNAPDHVKAVVVRTPDYITEDVVQVFCAAYLTDCKVPKTVEFIEALPRNSTGKVLKHLLRWSTA